MLFFYSLFAPTSFNGTTEIYTINSEKFSFFSLARSSIDLVMRVFTITTNNDNYDYIICFFVSFQRRNIYTIFVKTHSSTQQRCTHSTVRLAPHASASDDRSICSFSRRSLFSCCGLNVFSHPRSFLFLSARFARLIEKYLVYVYFIYSFKIMSYYSIPLYLSVHSFMLRLLKYPFYWLVFLILSSAGSFSPHCCYRRSKYNLQRLEISLAHLGRQRYVGTTRWVFLYTITFSKIKTNAFVASCDLISSQFERIFFFRSQQWKKYIETLNQRDKTSFSLLHFHWQCWYIRDLGKSTELCFLNSFPSEVVVN